MVIFIYEVVAMDLPNYFKIHAPAIFFVWFRINNLLCFKGTAANQDTDQRKKQPLANHKSLIFCLLKLKIAGKIPFFILGMMPWYC
jgi:hypothetical protein